MLQLETFEGGRYPLDQKESFKTVMCLQGVSDKNICCAFPTTLKGLTQIWVK